MKKVLAIVLTVAMVLGLAACGGGKTTPTNNSNTSPSSELAGEYKVLVWCPSEAKELTTKQIEDFNKSNTLGIKIVATVNEMSESDAGTQVLTDVSAAPDLYFFAQDQLARLVQGAAITKLGEGASKTVKEGNVADAIAAASTGDQLYAYPITADNGYFMYYDKSVIKEEDLGSLEKLIAACEAAGKNFSMETDTSAWYIASFFFGTGCVSEWKTDDAGNFVQVHDTFNSPEGLIAAKGLYKLQSSKNHVSSSSVADFSANPASAIVVSGTWAYNDVKKILGDNMGAAELPSFTVDGKEYHMGSFNGCKLLGVKPQTDAKKGAALNQLALFLTDYDRQLERFNTLGWGPSNTQAQAQDAVKNNEAQKAINAQKAHATMQGQIHGSWWDIAKVIGTDVQNSDGSDAGLQKALDNYSASINDLFKLDYNSKIFVGAWNGWNNADEKFIMAKDDKGNFSITVTVEQSDYMGGRIVKPGDWGKELGYAQVTEGKDLMNPDMADPAKNGDNNIVFAAPGTYTVTTDGTSITIVKAN